MQIESKTQTDEERETMLLVRRLEGELSDTMEDLDQKLGRVLAKQEYDYMRCYALFVKKKERELRDLIS